MAELADILKDEMPPFPDRCPRCGKKTIIKDNSFSCEDCGNFYYDRWLGIFRVASPSSD